MFRCSQCDMVFMTKHNSKRHEQWAHNRPFKVGSTNCTIQKDQVAAQGK